MKKFYLSCIESRIDNPKNLYARFKIGPFDKNHTLTIANNLRRALLSELNSLAIVAVRIQGVKHEYSSINGVRESVLDILLNIKQIALICDFQSHSPYIAYLSASGPGVVKAGDIKFPACIKCIDPDQEIATLSGDGHLKVAFLIYPGKNYWMELGSTQFMNFCARIFDTISSLLDDDSNIHQFLHSWQFEKTNILPIDAVFMPVNRVNYTIEVDEELDTEKPDEHIFFEIWTNGSIHPIIAIEQAATALIEMFTPFQHLQPFQMQPKFVGLTPLQLATIPYEKMKKPIEGEKLDNSGRISVGPEIEDELNPNSLLDVDIANLNLSLRPYTCLKRADIQNLRDLLSYSREELLLLKNFGKKSLEEVEDSIYKFGYFLSSKETNDTKTQ